MRPAEQGVALFAWMALFFLVDWRGDVGQREHLFVLTYSRICSCGFFDTAGDRLPSGSRCCWGFKLGWESR